MIHFTDDNQSLQSIQKISQLASCWPKPKHFWGTTAIWLRNSDIGSVSFQHTQHPHRLLLNGRPWCVILWWIQTALTWHCAYDNSRNSAVLICLVLYDTYLLWCGATTGRLPYPHLSVFVCVPLSLDGHTIVLGRSIWGSFDQQQSITWKDWLFSTTLLRVFFKRP